MSKASDKALAVAQAQWPGVDDRLKLLGELASLDPQPDSVPINALVPVPGTPLAEAAPPAAAAAPAAGVPPSAAPAPRRG